MRKSRTVLRLQLAAAAAALVIGMMAASGAQAQYPNDFAAQCATTSGMAQVDACMAALQYQPGNAELLRYLGDGLLTSGRPGGAFDAYSEALSANPSLIPAQSGRAEAQRQVNGRAPMPVSTVMYVPVQPVVVPQPIMLPVAMHPFDGTWRGAIGPRGQKFDIVATVVGGQFTLRMNDSTDRIMLRGNVTPDGKFAGEGFLRDKNKLYGAGDNDQDKLAIIGRFTAERFEGTGSAGSKYTTLQLVRVPN